MKVDVFKKLIKEAVKEVLQEELVNILSENKKQVENTSGTFTKYEEYKPVRSENMYRPTGDPIMDLLQETRANMTSGDYKTMISMDSSMAQGGMPNMGSMISGPEPGLDISQLSFVKNAGKVFQASVEKDKQRFGG
jgi:hypothetical protein